MGLLKKLAHVQQELKAPKNQFNKFGNYNYRSAEDIIEAVKPLLFSEDLLMTITDRIVNVGDRYYVEATVTIENDEGSRQVTGIAREAEEQKGMADAQITGSASSYARKYALNGMFGIDDTKDDDTRDNKSTTKTTAQKEEPSTKVSGFYIDKLRKLGEKHGYGKQAMETRIGNLQNNEEAKQAIAVMEALATPVSTDKEPFTEDK